MEAWIAQGCQPSSEGVIQKPLLVRRLARIPRECPGNLDPGVNLHPGKSLGAVAGGESRAVELPGWRGSKFLIH